MVCASSEGAELKKMMNKDQGMTTQLLRTGERSVAYLKKAAFIKQVTIFANLNMVSSLE